MGGPKENMPPPSDKKQKTKESNGGVSGSAPQSSNMLNDGGDNVRIRKRKFELMDQWNKDRLDLPPEGQPSAPSTALPGSLNNAANFQKVCFIHIYEEAQNK